jgi:alpha-beta hydrolase superfamily lysophospholipase
VPLALFAGGDKPVVPENPVILPAGEETEKTVTELGAPGSRYLYIHNANPDLSGAVEIIEVTGE